MPQPDPQLAVEPLESFLPLDDPELREIVEMWAQTLDERLVEMRDALESQSLETLAQLAHWLKGSGGTAGYDAFTTPASELEQQANAGQVDLIAKQLDELEKLAAGVHAGLK